jgi:hypothetical protein
MGRQNGASSRAQPEKSVMRKFAPAAAAFMGGMVIGRRRKKKMPDPPYYVPRKK